ncbi:MAG TPA: hypothetical protein VGQ81_02770 [Acidobacteriota bacterium]|nr:hypothetical protein [Acidobacteriota bacterium]
MRVHHRGTATWVFALILCWTLCMSVNAQSIRHQGTWNNSTFGSSGSLQFDTQVTGGNVTMTFKQGGNAFGAGEAPAVTLNGTIGANGITFTKTGDPRYGDVTINIGLDGALSFRFDRIPVSGIQREEATGNMTANAISFDFTIFFTNGSTARGTGTATRVSGSLPSPLFFGQFGNGGGITSDVVLPNPSNKTIGGTAVFADDNGNPLTVGIATVAKTGEPVASFAAQNRVDFSVPPLGSVRISTDGLGGVVAGSAVVLSEDLLGGIIRFFLPGIGIAGVGQSRPLSSFIIPVRRKAGGINTGVALRSTSSKPVTISLSLRRGTQEVAATSLANFPAGGHLARFIDQIFTNVNTDDFEGTLVVRVTGGQVAATALELGSLPGQFTTLPVTALTSP